ncbi:precorrin-6y C5,15-methyltransferase (decarboxylating) subunit CbiE [Rhizobiales bacterium]|uniref:precorrin-6y C5,15-methyltransferase (decarboxylating) subunit CbiE n=1 Tax=Hongsoonwoonella zoysiae TaxID=2821844 RepID=UPI00155F5AAE|nr:precorrin-6y C5,15-methyltransferase (decarboxylating) subunit CbiE [Hongsoonwoonella zoysiae]NRG16368.1 precorrin-6y C5,15-methyltransferase (decarboxylating) subunit CbiE [Hongsoonwoonella zoysiae]
MTGPWLTVIGIGEDGPAGLSEIARSALKSAEFVIGGKRHLALAGPLTGESMEWPAPFSDGLKLIEERRGKPTVALATGDPMCFGLGATLSRRFSAREMTVIPAPSSFSLAASRLCWPLQDVETLSFHGRPLDGIRAHLYPGARLLCLTANGETPRLAADILADEGYGASRMTVLEHLGGPRERIVSGIAESWHERGADLNLMAIEAVPVRDTPVRARVPGLPDDAFRHDGKITKREIRAATLAKLEPHAGALLWDIGAGSGSVSIEWMRSSPRARAIALEPNAERRGFALANAAALGTPGLDLRDASAPEGLEGLAQPDAVFFGGGLTAPGVVEVALDVLKSGGRLVANAVTLESEAVLLKAFEKHGGELCRLSIQRASPVGGLTGWRPLMPVTQWSLVKP